MVEDLRSLLFKAEHSALLTPCPEMIVPRVFHNLLVRHGDPLEYAQRNSALSQVGRLRSVLLAEQIAQSFRFSPASEYIIAIWHSGRARTIETAEILQASLLLIKTKLDARKIRVLTGLQCISHMSPEEALRPLLEAGVAKENLYKTWINAPLEFLEKKNAKTPRKLEDEVLEFLMEASECSLILGKGAPVINIFVTSETTLGALAQKRFPNQDIRTIGFCEVLRATTGLTGEDGLMQIEYEFRGETWVENTPWCVISLN
ncbi:MAG: hypothetical protein HYW33_01050 [Candidatus Blackburnbacteria bacterium]|nr:hypothetical protein [Candidatus Blackburnbacteria bacterium]